MAEGYLNDFLQSSPRGHADLALGFIKLGWGLFEGGKRVAELRVAGSRIREALAQSAQKTRRKPFPACPLHPA